MAIIDCFTLYNELDILELRLDFLNDHVDKFILVESRQTFVGKEKPLYYEENKERFAKWNDKIIHIVAPNIELKDPNCLFERHWFAYNLMEEELKKFAPEDIAFVSDLDEFWNPEIIKQIDENPHILVQLNYCYWLNYKSNEDWTGSIMTKIKNIRKDFFKESRATKVFPLRDGGWHFTNCMGVEQIIKKLEAYDHSNEIIPVLSQYEGYGVKERMEKGYDFLGRYLNYQGVPYKFEVDEKDWPKWLKENKERYIKLCKS